MTAGADCRKLFWYTIRTHPKQERRADDNLRVLQVETLVPRLKESRYNPYTGEPEFVIKHLFPGYIFARFNPSEVLHKVRFTRGIHSVVSFNNNPAVVDDDIISIIQSRIGNDGLVRTADKLKQGDPVMIKEGPFKTFTGIFECEMKGAERIVILLNTLSYQARYVINRALIKKIGDPV